MRLTDEQIGAELHALRDTPSEDFAATLDRRVAAAFPTAKRKAGDRELTWRLLAPVLAGLAAIAVVAVIASNSNETKLASTGASKSAPSESIAPAQGQALSREQQRQAQAFGQASVPPTPAPPSGTRPRNGQPQVQELSAALGLSTDASKIQDAADGVVEVTSRY